jgi:hypothetical protein
MSLRQIGQEPTELPAYVFTLGGVDQAGNPPYAVPKFESPRTERVKKVEIGMSGREVIDTLGAPDLITMTRTGRPWRSRWEYDIDGAEPYTLCVTWEGINVLSTSEKRPPEWRGSKERVKEILY